ncbi:MAG TPA: hypothetical protein VK459_14690 [Polyangiaceae bacterium]|nr:hypothetical protein [Polyangiaceae bacterium]
MVASAKRTSAARTNWVTSRPGMPGVGPSEKTRGRSGSVGTLS